MSKQKNSEPFSVAFANWLHAEAALVKISVMGTNKKNGMVHPATRARAEAKVDAAVLQLMSATKPQSRRDRELLMAVLFRFQRRASVQHADTATTVLCGLCK